MKAEVYSYYSPLPSREVDMERKTPFVLLRESTINNLRGLLVFGTTSKVGHCTKFLISRVHNGSLWLNKEYLIHVEDIHQLTGLLMEPDDGTKGFQGSRKCGKKKGEPTLYDKFNTRQGGRVTVLEPILHELVCYACYLIAYIVMSTYT
jgi:hypothetical protein